MKRLYHFSCLVASVLMLLTSADAMAQRSPQAVVPGSQGTLPTNLPVLTPAHEGEIPGLTLDSYYLYANYGLEHMIVDLKLPYPFDTDIEYFTMYVDGKVLHDEYGAPRKFRDNASLQQTYTTATYQAEVHGGVNDGKRTNVVTVNIPQSDISTQIHTTFWSNNDAVVGIKIDAPEVTLYHHVEGATDEDIEKTYQYTWIRRNPNNYEDTVIEGATQNFYTPTVQDAGYLIVCQITGDNKLTRFGAEFTLGNGDPVYLPVFCSFDYYDNDGFIINTDYVLPNKNDIKPKGMYWGEDGEFHEEYAKVSEVVELQPGKYKVIGEFDTAYPYNLEYPFSNPAIMFAARYQMFGDEVMIRREVMLRPDESGKFIFLKNSSATFADTKFNFYGKNIDGNIVLKRSVEIDPEYPEIYVPQGNYYVQAETTCDDDVPTYYPGVTSWKDAQMVEFSGWDTDTIYIDMQKYYAAPAGSYSIEGTIQKAVATRAAGEVVSGISVFLFNASNNVVGLTTTDAEGKFRFSYLAAGDYYVMPELASFETAKSEVITLGSDTDKAVANYTMTDSGFVPASTDGISSLLVNGKSTFSFDLLGRKAANGSRIQIVDGKKVIK